VIRTESAMAKKKLRLKFRKNTVDEMVQDYFATVRQR